MMNVGAKHELQSEQSNKEQTEPRAKRRLVNGGSFQRRHRNHQRRFLVANGKNWKAPCHPERGIRDQTHVCLSIRISSTTAIVCLATSCVSGGVVSGRPSLTVTTPFKLAILNFLLENLDIVNNTDRRSVLGRWLELGIG